MVNEYPNFEVIKNTELKKLNYLLDKAKNDTEALNQLAKILDMNSADVDRAFYTSHHYNYIKTKIYRKAQRIAAATISSNKKARINGLTKPE